MEESLFTRFALFTKIPQFLLKGRGMIVCPEYCNVSLKSQKFMYGLQTKCEVKIAGYWPSSFFFCVCVTRSMYQFLSSMVSAPVLLVKSYANKAKQFTATMTSAKIPPLRRHYVIRKIKNDICVYEINQNQILFTARTSISENRCYQEMQLTKICKNCILFKRERNLSQALQTDIFSIHIGVVGNAFYSGLAEETFSYQSFYYTDLYEIVFS